MTTSKTVAAPSSSDAVQGVVIPEHVPEPHDSRMNRTLIRLRRRLFNLIEATVPLHRQDEARSQIKTITRDAWNEERALVLELLGLLDK